MAWDPPLTAWPIRPPTDVDLKRIEGNAAFLKNASSRDIVDAGGYFSTKTVEFALQQLKNWSNGT
jgi:hypothetical protein